MSSNIGIIGLGNMGGALARRLIRAGTVLAFDPNPEARRAVHEAGAVAVESVAEVAAADAVFLCLPNPTVSRSVATELAANMSEGAIVVETSTVNASDMMALDEILQPRGIRCVDVAILSGVQPMLDGTAPLLTGGSEEDLASIAGILQHVSTKVTHYGPLGAGMAAKVINNAVAHTVMVLLAEVAAMGASAGISVQQLVDMFSDPMAGLIRPLTHRLGERVAEDNYDGGMPTDAARKDSTLALEFAQRAGVPLFTIQAAHTVYEIALAQGLARNDYAAIASLWETWTGQELA